MLLKTVLRFLKTYGEGTLSKDVLTSSFSRAIFARKRFSHHSPASHLREPTDFIKVRKYPVNRTGLAFVISGRNKLASFDVPLANPAPR